MLNTHVAQLSLFIVAIRRRSAAEGERESCQLGRGPPDHRHLHAHIPCPLFRVALPQEVTVISATRIPDPVEQTFFQKYQTWIMMGCFMLFNYYTKSRQMGQASPPPAEDKKSTTTAATAEEKKNQ